MNVCKRTLQSQRITRSRRTVIQGLFQFPLRNWLKEYQIGAHLIIQEAKLQNFFQ